MKKRQKQSVIWDKYSNYYDWEFELICTNQKKDVSLWIELAEKFGDPILECGCGSGRLTLPLIKKGFQVTALDISEKMLDILRSKAQGAKNLTTVCGDMTSFKINREFRFAFVGYSTFQLLLTLKEQIKCLSNIRDHLSSKGILGLDICPTICDIRSTDDRGHSYTAFCHHDKTVISRSSSVSVDKLSQITHWHDTYEIIDFKGENTVFHNYLSMKGIKPDFMELLLKYCGYKTLMVYDSFEKRKVRENAEVLVYLAQKVNNKPPL